MIFSSISFLYYFLPATIILYFLIKDKYKNFVLLLCSLLFYFVGEPVYCLLMILSAFSGYIHGLLIEKYKGSKYSKYFLISSIVISVGLLGLFKYSNFFIDNLNNVFNLNIKFLKLVLPIGISFYTFQIVSYTIDIYKGQANLCKKFTDFATYVCLFPQLIAGPIVRYTSIQNELNNRDHSFEKFSYGTTRFIVGLSKKVLIANNLGILVEIFNSTNEKSILFYWISAIAFSLQIYFDFLGYSYMAIGLGKIFGFNFPENFNYPYISKSISEFWRRWHISLGSFFRDYVYIPLGGNRVKKSRWILNIFIVWFLTGFWHGASWNFILWGLYFAIFLIAEKLFLNRVLEKLPCFICSIYLIFFIIISFVIFNSDNVKDIFIYLSNMFGRGDIPISNDISVYYLKSYFLLLVISSIGSTPLLKIIVDKIKKNEIGVKIISYLEVIFNIALLLLITAYLIDGSFNPFLYFRF
ncbi:MBOAT family O-acyltransferase [Terrisporobacter sp.]|uniref:MBOAT family O-acyltransferase n=1 Tax=Terrisporobacter sp. TaxID=1965305 RepID=UPI002624173F|nr:MBOAT family O-acyltransferase [Terrisporobacter sp.]